LGLRLKTRDATWPQRPVPLKSRTGLLIQKRAANSIMVSLCKGDADCFWAFESPDVEEASSGEEAPDVPGDCDEEEDGDDAEKEEDSSPREKVFVKNLPSLHHYQGLRGFIVNSRGNKIEVVFPCGAPPKAFLPEHLDRIPLDASMKDRLTAGAKVWLSRGPGVSTTGMGYLRAQKRKRAVVRMLGWSDFYKKFVLALDDSMEERHMVRLTFAQTGIVRSMSTTDSDSDSTDPKACSSDSSTEK